MTKTESLASLVKEVQVSESLAYLTSSIKYSELSDEVIDRTKYLALDYLGLAARGSIFSSSEPIHTLLRTIGGVGEGVVVGNKDLRPSYQYAALANGSASHSLELDDVINEASLHPAVVIFPTVFAVGEKYGKTGQEIIEASVAGYEVMGRLGKALHPSNVYARGFHPTAVVGAFGAVAAASKLLNL